MIPIQPVINENENVSYWLKKLYKQGEEKLNNLPPKIQEERILEEKGKDKNIENQAIKKEEDRQTVNDLVMKSNRCIFSISSLFPWDFFPNSINIEESRVTFIFRQFLSSQSHSIEIKDISNVFIESSIFFATIQVVSRNYVENDVRIGFLQKNKAFKTQKIIEGLRIFIEHDINTSNYEIVELIEKIEEFHKNKIM